MASVSAPSAGTRPGTAAQPRASAGGSSAGTGADRGVRLLPPSARRELRVPGEVADPVEPGVADPGVVGAALDLGQAEPGAPGLDKLVEFEPGA